MGPKDPSPRLRLRVLPFVTNLIQNELNLLQNLVNLPALVFVSSKITDCLIEHRIILIGSLRTNADLQTLGENVYTACLLVLGSGTVNDRNMLFLLIMTNMTGS